MPWLGLLIALAAERTCALTAAPSVCVSVHRHNSTAKRYSAEKSTVNSKLCLKLATQPHINQTTEMVQILHSNNPQKHYKKMSTACALVFVTHNALCCIEPSKYWTFKVLSLQSSVWNCYHHPTKLESPTLVINVGIRSQFEHRLAC